MEEFNDKCCSICDGDGKLVALPCGHVCCETCFETMYCKMLIQTCPYCRKSFKEMEELAEKLLEYSGKLIPLNLKYLKDNRVFTILSTSIDTQKIKIYEPIRKQIGEFYVDKHPISYDNSKLFFIIMSKCCIIHPTYRNGDIRFKCCIKLNNNCNSNEDDIKNYELIHSFETKLTNMLHDIYPDTEFNKLIKDTPIPDNYEFPVVIEDISLIDQLRRYNTTLDCILIIYVKDIIKTNSRYVHNKLYCNLLLQQCVIKKGINQYLQ